ncbi:hypothetical protein LCGC14_2784740 [marine sediment metagenome]|uniref:Peptidase C39 domain-containing protein n=1 Tax=marine sediment metagenome TaxID=412755 RepID=A0A0F8YS90_9ZZZZ
MQKSRFVQQRMPADCGVAALAMFLGRSYEDIARHCSGAELVQYGLAWSRERHICGLFKVKVEVVDSSLVDWRRAAVLTVPSLNDDKGQTHAVYWDGRRAWDPQHGREGYAAYTNQRAKEFTITAVRRVK